MTFAKQDEIKPKTAQALCGETFIKAWKLVCRFKERKRYGRSLIKGEISSFC